MKIGFVGFGNMAGAIAGGILASGKIPCTEVCVYDHGERGRAKAAEKGFTLLSSCAQVADQAEYIFLCVKPQNFPEILPQLATANLAGKIIVSIAAGITTATIKSVLGKGQIVVRTMPNTPLLVGCGTTVISADPRMGDTELTFVKEIFESVGTVYELPEDKINETVSLNGSTPAFIYLLADTAAQNAVKYGIAYETALAMFCDTLKGSAEMMLKTGKTPQELITMVSSKGGTTVAALDRYQELGLAPVFAAGLDRCIERAYEMGKEKK